MKNLAQLLASLTLVVTLFACSQAPQAESPQTLSGTITNGDLDTVIIYNSGDFFVKLPVDSGSFGDTLDLEEGYYNIRIGRESTAMYWDSAYQIDLSVDLDEFDESISYEGYGAEENNFLATVYLIKEQQGGRDLYLLEENTFIDSLNSIKSGMIALADSLNNQSFTDEQKQNAEYDFNQMLYSYESTHPYLTRNDSFELSESFYDNLLPYDKNNAEAIDRSESYRSMLSTYAHRRFGELAEDTNSQVVIIKNLLEEFESNKVKSHILDRFSYFLMMPNKDLDESFALIRSVVEDSAKLTKYQEAYETLAKLKAGNPSPDFNEYENHAGGSTSLADLKGKYVYIDVWATWCGPCIREIPFLQKLEEDYEEEKIQFVSISVDRENDHETWVKMVKDKELGGIQLFADDSWQSDFVEDYHIKGIPRFILIDPQGNILDADAKRPSNPELKLQLNELLDETAKQSS